MRMSATKKELTLPTWAVMVFGLVQTLITGFVTYMGNQAASDVRYEKFVADMELKIQATNSRIDLLAQELTNKTNILDLRIENNKKQQVTSSYIGPALKPEEPDANRPKMIAQKR